MFEDSSSANHLYFTVNDDTVEIADGDMTYVQK